ncbi:MAG: TatD family hydrolase [Candidatus Bathyarchaeota archaeon]|nr:TatD family hydrolase [Candidatus Bathyarchaeota archaeon]
MFVDTHAHLQWRSFDKDRTLVIKRAKKADVARIVNVGFDIDNCNKAIELAKKNKGLYATVGIHPHNASQLNEKTLKELKKLLKNPVVVAFGEIGLDYYRNLSPKEIQKQAFINQLSLASEYDLPVVIHNRDAASDILTIISKFKNKITGIMHCFSGDKDFAKKSIRLGFLISFAGTVTYSKAQNIQETAKWINLENMLIETDCPWLAPQSMRGKRNESSYLPSIAQKIADLKQLTVKEVADATTENAQKIFNIT